MTAPLVDLHGLSPDAFQDEVHSFEFWFESVTGYLAGRPHGRSAETPDPHLEEGERDRLATVLCNYCVGELAALEGASGLISIAPNRNTKIFLATQVVDEARHLEVLCYRLQELGIDRPDAEIGARASPTLLAFRARLAELVASGDWEAALFAQNVILEAMEFTVFQAHAERADAVTREILEGIVKDERRHLGFGENGLGQRLAEAPAIRARLVSIKTELDSLVLHTFEETLAKLDVPKNEQLDLGKRYLAATRRLGLVS